VSELKRLRHHANVGTRRRIANPCLRSMGTSEGAACLRHPLRPPRRNGEHVDGLAVPGDFEPPVLVRPQTRFDFADVPTCLRPRGPIIGQGGSLGVGEWFRAVNVKKILGHPSQRGKKGVCSTRICGFDDPQSPLTSANRVPRLPAVFH
jgi:hypothetical protein